jgi:glycosyltransferase involved in cell wall biosynthesis
VVLTAAMMRPGVKAEGIAAVVKACAGLVANGIDLKLVVAGDGSQRLRLEQLAHRLLGGRAVFTGRIERQELFRLYSAADLFVFPGVEESLGMVYLEAQSCGLPVVAFGDWGGGEAVIEGATGLLCPAGGYDQFSDNISRLLQNPALRITMAQNAASHIRANHDLQTNYTRLEQHLQRLVDAKQ